MACLRMDLNAIRSVSSGISGEVLWACTSYQEQGACVTSLERTGHRHSARHGMFGRNDEEQDLNLSWI
jgi:hypothetical protein